MRLTLPQLPAEWGRPALYAMAVLLSLPGLYLTAWEIWSGRPPWLDEAFSMGMVSVLLQSPGHFLSMLMTDVHPPLYYLLLAAWTQVFGDGVGTGRALSFCAALGAVALLWWRGAGLLSRTTLAIATVWICTHWLFLGRIYQIRMYALVLLGGIWLSLRFAHLWTQDREPSARELGLFCLGAFLLAMLHYAAMAFACAAMLLVLFRYRHRTEAWLLIGGAGSACLLWALPNALHATYLPAQSVQFTLRLPGWEAAAVTLYKIGLSSSPGLVLKLREFEWSWAHFQALAMVIPAVATLVVLRADVRQAGSFGAWWRDSTAGPEWALMRSQLWLLAVFLPPLILIHDLFTPILLPRVMMVAIPSLAICIAVALGTIWHRRPWGLFAVVLLLAAPALNSSYRHWETLRPHGFDRAGMQAVAKRWIESGSAEGVYSPYGRAQRSYPGLPRLVKGGGWPEDIPPPAQVRPREVHRLTPPFYYLNVLNVPHGSKTHFLEARFLAQGWRVEVLAPQVPLRANISWYVSEP